MIRIFGWQIKKEAIRKAHRRLFFVIALLGLAALIYDSGIREKFHILKLLNWIYIITLCSGIVFIIYSYLNKKFRTKVKAWLVDAISIIFYGLLIINLSDWATIDLLNERIWVNFAVVVIFFRALAAIRFDVNRKYLNPTQLFITSFVFIIFTGTILLLLPNATHTKISFLDALFTSTSAVCVTGLIVVDTGSYFTHFGQTIILLLIQAGGIGIMTFTSYFGYFFKGGASFQNRLMMQDMNNSDKAAEVFSTLKKIIIVTFLIEIVGAAIIYASIKSASLEPPGGSIFFSIFHSISGFCNAGFSTLENSLYESGYRFNYMLHITIAVLFIIGGLGFPIVFNSFTYLKHLIVDRLLRKESIYTPWIIGINTRIVIITTLCLLGVGTMLFYIFEFNNTLAEH